MMEVRQGLEKYCRASRRICGMGGNREDLKDFRGPQPCKLQSMESLNSILQ
jgi:hypothetical protein